MSGAGKSDPMPWLKHFEETFDPGPAPEAYAVCTVSLAWARSRGIPDSDLCGLAEEFRSRNITFFEWDRHPVDLVDGSLRRYGDERPRCPVRRDAAWDGKHLALRTPVAGKCHLSGGKLVVPGGLPRTIMNTLRGRPLGELVDLGFPVDAVIASATERDGVKVTTGFGADPAWNGMREMEIEVEPRWTMVAAS